MSTVTAVDTSKLCKVTNNSNQATNSSDNSNPPPGFDIVVAMPLTSAETDLSPNPIVSYNKDFEILALAEPGSPIIKPGSSGTVTLDRTYKDDDGNDVYSLGYDLLISTGDWYRPVANISVLQDWDPDDHFDPQTFTADDNDAMTQTLNFYQTVAAYPTSALAQTYANSMSQADKNADSKADGSANSGQAVNDSITTDTANFFKSTTSYQK